MQFDNLAREYSFGVAVFDNAQIEHSYAPGVFKLRFEGTTASSLARR